MERGVMQGYTTVKHLHKEKVMTWVSSKFKNYVIIRQDMTDDNIVTVYITFSEKTVTVINIYDKPGGDKNKSPNKYKTKIKSLRTNVIMGGDMNGKNTMRGGNVNDDRGENIRMGNDEQLRNK